MPCVGCTACMGVPARDLIQCMLKAMHAADPRIARRGQGRGGFVGGGAERRTCGQQPVPAEVHYLPVCRSAARRSAAKCGPTCWTCGRSRRLLSRAWRSACSLSSWRRSDGAWSSRSSVRSGLQGPAWGRSRWAGLMEAACAGRLVVLGAAPGGVESAGSDWGILKVAS